jgi:hypothetical protein
MFTPCTHAANHQHTSVRRRAMPTACVTVKATPKNPTQDAPHSIFLDTQKNFQYGAIVTESPLDTELHIETTTIMFADAVESARLITDSSFFNSNNGVFL